jgi:hypothetical protein
MKLLSLLLAALVATLAATVQAQNLTLFEALESSPDVPSAPRPAQQAALAQNGNPAFTLRSISRFGDEYRSVLVDRNGNKVDVLWRQGERMELPGVGGHVVIEANSRQLVVQHASNESCVESKASGVSCRGANTSVLTLATLSPVQAAPQSQPQQGRVQSQIPGQAQGQFRGRLPQGSNAVMLEGGETVVIDQDGNRVVINPFVDAAFAGPQPVDPALAPRMDRMQQRNGERINAEDLPVVGTRVVRTPFGDRLVPVRE